MENRRNLSVDFTTAASALSVEGKRSLFEFITRDLSNKIVSTDDDMVRQYVLQRINDKIAEIATQESIQLSPITSLFESTDTAPITKDYLQGADFQWSLIECFIASELQLDPSCFDQQHNGLVVRNVFMEELRTKSSQMNNVSSFYLLVEMVNDFDNLRTGNTRSDLATIKARWRLDSLNDNLFDPYMRSQPKGRHRRGVSGDNSLLSPLSINNPPKNPPEETRNVKINKRKKNVRKNATQPQSQFQPYNLTNLDFDQSNALRRKFNKKLNFDKINAAEFVYGQYIEMSKREIEKYKLSLHKDRGNFKKIQESLAMIGDDLMAYHDFLLKIYNHLEVIRGGANNAPVPSTYESRESAILTALHRPNYKDEDEDRKYLHFILEKYLQDNNDLNTIEAAQQKIANDLRKLRKCVADVDTIQNNITRFPTSTNIGYGGYGKEISSIVIPQQPAQNQTPLDAARAEVGNVIGVSGAANPQFTVATQHQNTKGYQASKPAEVLLIKTDVDIAGTPHSTATIRQHDTSTGFVRLEFYFAGPTMQAFENEERTGLFVTIPGKGALDWLNEQKSTLEFVKMNDEEINIGNVSAAAKPLVEATLLYCKAFNVRYYISPGIEKEYNISKSQVELFRKTWENRYPGDYTEKTKLELEQKIEGTEGATIGDKVKGAFNKLRPQSSTGHYTGGGGSQPQPELKLTSNTPSGSPRNSLTSIDTNPGNQKINWSDYESKGEGDRDRHSSLLPAEKNDGSKKTTGKGRRGSW